MLIGGFFERNGTSWGDEEMAWFEDLLEEQDVDIMAWALGTQPAPARYEGPMMRRLQTIDYIRHPQ